MTNLDPPQHRGPDERQEEIHRLLHVLWTKAVGLPNYRKSEWLRLQQLIQEITGTPFLPVDLPTPDSGSRIPDELRRSRDDLP